MNVFSINDGNEYELTRDNFINLTHKKFPFYQDAKKYKTPHFAICPVCNNPIQIINLLGVKFKEENTGRTDMHGRHFIKNVEGLPKCNKEKYEACILHNPISFRIVEDRKNELFNEEIKELVKNNVNKISTDIRIITGILFTNNNINKIIDDYIVARDYCYTNTNRYNIPYSILYTREAISLFGQKIGSSELGEKIIYAIQEKSIYFSVELDRIEKKVREYVSIDLLVVNHRISGSKQYMTIRIEEEYQEEVHNIFEEEIEMKQYIY